MTSLNGRVQLFAPDGRYLGRVGSRGGEVGEFIAPHAMVEDGRGKLYVVDSGNHRIQVLEVPCPKDSR